MALFKNSIFNIKIIFLISLLSLAGLSLFTYMQNAELIKRAMLVNHTNLVKLELSNHLSYLKDAETGNRGFILLQDSSYLEPYNSALVNVPAALKKLDSLVHENTKQKIALKNLANLSYKRLAVLKEFRNSIINTETIKKFMPRGKAQMDAVRTQTILMIHVQHGII